MHQHYVTLGYDFLQRVHLASQNHAQNPYRSRGLLKTRIRVGIAKNGVHHAIPDAKTR